MLDLKSLQTKSTKKKKRVGRGTSSGSGKTCGRGNKGQNSRSGGTKGIHFEGGQTPIYRRVPKKRGFKNILFSKKFAVVNLGDLNKFEKSVGPKELMEAGLVREGQMIKVLGSGELKKGLNVTAHSFSKSAKEIIEKSGGKAEVC